MLYRNTVSRENTSETTSKFQRNFRMYFDSNRDQHKSIVFEYSGSMLLQDSSGYGSMSILLFKASSRLDQLVKEALLYRSPI